MKKIGEYLHHVPLRHRVTASVLLIVGSGIIYWWTRSGEAKMVAELALAPHIDRLIYGVLANE